jgi:hypothetical protein
MPADEIVGSFPASHSGTRTYPGQGCCVPLTIQGSSPEQMELLLLGGSSGQAPEEHTDATHSAEKFVFTVNNPGASRWEPVADIPQRRFMSDGVLLPDGTVLLVNATLAGASPTIAPSPGSRLSFTIPREIPGRKWGQRPGSGPTTPPLYCCWMGRS